MPATFNRYHLYREAAGHLARFLWSALWLGVFALLAGRLLPGLTGETSLEAPDALITLLTLGGTAGSLLACGCWYWTCPPQESLAAVWGKLWFGLLPGLLLPGLHWQVEPVLLVLGAACLLALTGVVFLKSAPPSNVPTGSPDEQARPALPQPASALTVVPEEEETEPPADDPHLLLTFSRRLDDRGETIEGTARLVFPAGDAICVLHLPISPPLAEIPQVECQLLTSEPSVRISVTARHPYGLRIEGRRSLQLGSPLLIPVWFQITAIAARRAA